MARSENENGYGLNVLHGVDADGDERGVRKQGRCAHRVPYNRHQLHFGAPETVPGGVSLTVDLTLDREETVVETDDFKPWIFVTGMEAAREREAEPTRREKLPTVRVFRIRGQRWQECLRYCD